MAYSAGFVITNSYVDPVGFCPDGKLFLFLPVKPKMLVGRWCSVAILGFILRVFWGGDFFEKRDHLLARGDTYGFCCTLATLSLFCLKPTVLLFPVPPAHTQPVYIGLRPK